MVHHDGMVNAATFQKEVQVGLQLLQVPPQLRRLEFARTTPSGTHFALFKPNSIILRHDEPVNKDSTCHGFPCFCGCVLRSRRLEVLAGL